MSKRFSKCLLKAWNEMKERNFMSFIYADTAPRNNPDHEAEIPLDGVSEIRKETSPW